MSKKKKIEDEPRYIGNLGNYYGSLKVITENGKYYWSIEDYDGEHWQEIPKELFDALNAYEDSYKFSQSQYL